MNSLADQPSSEPASAATLNLADLNLPNQVKDAKPAKDTAVVKDNSKDNKCEAEHDPTHAVASLPQTPPAPLPMLDWALPVPVVAIPKPEDSQTTQAADPALSEAAMPITAFAQTPVTLPTSPLAVKPKVAVAKEEELLSNLQISAPPSQDSSDKMALAFGATLTEQQKKDTSTRVDFQADSKPMDDPSADARQQSANLYQSEVSTGPELKENKSRLQTVNAEPKPDSKAQSGVEPEPRNWRGPEPVNKPAEPVFTLANAPVVSKPAEHTATKEVKSPEPVAHLETLDTAPPRTEPARDISFRIGTGSSDAVDVKLMDRAGQIHVAVRSADAALTKSLQTNVTELAQKLDRSGFHTETSIPGYAEPVREAQQGQAFQDSSRDRRAPQQDQQRPKKRSQPSAAVFSLNALQPIQQENQ